jgi:hypothetical protein
MHELPVKLPAAELHFAVSEAKTTVSFDGPECFLQRPADRNSMNLNVRKRRPCLRKETQL